MDTLSLEYYIRVCELKNISKAAKSLFISQQALSKTIYRLENEFNSKFFVRSRAGVELTEAGHRFLTYALSTVGQHSRIRHTLDVLQQERKNHVSFGYCTGMMTHFPEHFISDFIDRNPDASISLYSFQDDPYHRAILSGDPRLILGSSHPGSSDYQVLSEAHSKLAIMMAYDHPLSCKDILSWEDISDYPIININIENEYNRNLQLLLKEKGILPQYIINPAEYPVTNDLILKHNALTIYGGNRAILPPCFTVRPMTGLDLEMDFYLCAHKDAKLNTSEQRLVNDIEEVMKCFLSSSSLSSDTLV